MFQVENLIVVLFAASIVNADINEEALYDRLMENYNKIALPVKTNDNNLTIRFGASLIRIIGVVSLWRTPILNYGPVMAAAVFAVFYGYLDTLQDERNQVLTTNVWLELEWQDFNLEWNPDDFGGVKKIHIPSQELWLPDIVLYNNAAGFPEINIFTDANVYFDGTISWKPPAIYKSFCFVTSTCSNVTLEGFQIDVLYFPYDEQTCVMKFGLWSHDGSYVDMRYLKGEEFVDVVKEDGTIGQFIEKGMDLAYYYKSGSWDLMNITGLRSEVVYSGCCGPVSFVDISYTLTLRRKPLFFTAFLIIPCVCISFLTIFVFHLPADSNAKIGFALSIMVTVSVFFLVLIDLIPPTSLVIPLFGKYLLFTVVFVTMSVVISVIVVNIHCRKSNDVMGPWMKKILLEWLPRLLRMQRPDTGPDEVLQAERATLEMKQKLSSPPPSANGKKHYGPVLAPPVAYDQRRHSPCYTTMNETKYDEQQRIYYHIFLGVVKNIQFITHHFKAQAEEDEMSADWMYAAAVIDKFMTWIFTFTFFVGTMLVVLSAPSLFDRRPPLEIPTPNNPLGGDTRDLHIALEKLAQQNALL